MSNAISLDNNIAEMLVDIVGSYIKVPLLVVGGIIVLGAVAAVVVIVLRKRKKK